MILPILSDKIIKTIHHTHQIKEKIKFFIGSEITNTHTTVGIFKNDNQKQTLLIEYHAKNKDINDIYILIKDILSDLKEKHSISISAACFAIPGLAKGDVFLHPHLPWNTTENNNSTAQRGVSKEKFVTISGLDEVHFINDFQAVAIGTQIADNSTFKKLHKGKDQPKKPKLVIGAGNGLGASLLIWDNELKRYVPSQLNYSFTEFGGQTDLEFAFFNFMKDKTGNIAWGKVLGAGAGGIKLIYRFFDDYDKNKKFEKSPYNHDKFVEYENYLDIFKNYDKSPRCYDAVELFMELYARIIRNAAYAQAVADVYITNTVVQEFPELFSTNSFIQQIINLEGKVTEEGSKKYLEGYLNDISFFLVTNPKVQLYGAAALCIEPNLIRN